MFRHGTQRQDDTSGAGMNDGDRADDLYVLTARRPCPRPAAGRGVQVDQITYGAAAGVLAGQLHEDGRCAIGPVCDRS